MEKHGVDLDGTLAEYYTGQYDAGKIGTPIDLMVQRVKKWLEMGDEVALLTARMATVNGEEEIEKFLTAWKPWCVGLFGRELEATAEKDYTFTDFWDDRAVRVELNTGMLSTQGEVVDPLTLGDADSIGEFLG
jgi:hypothetical protein